jgi:hypothetical protein
MARRKGFGLLDTLGIAEFLANLADIEHDILSWIEALPAQLSGPRSERRVRMHPCQSAAFAICPTAMLRPNGSPMFIDSATGPGVRHCHADGVGDILDVSVRHSPFGFSFIQQYSLSPVAHTSD